MLKLTSLGSIFFECVDIPWETANSVVPILIYGGAKITAANLETVVDDLNIRYAA
jgi:hypothetical protein